MRALTWSKIGARESIGPRGAAGRYQMAGPITSFAMGNFAIIWDTYSGTSRLLFHRETVPQSRVIESPFSIANRTRNLDFEWWPLCELDPAMLGKNAHVHRLCGRLSVCSAAQTIDHCRH